jgi:hypothetical protein
MRKNNRKEKKKEFPGLLINSIPYRLDNKKYEIRVFKTDKGYLVQTYRNNKRADKYSYRVKYSVKKKLELQKGGDVLSELVEAAKEGLKIYNSILSKKRRIR